MRTRTPFLFNEKTEVERIIKEGFPDNKIDYGRMYMVAKYLKEKFKYGEIRLERELIIFCKTQDKDFNPIVEADSIKKWIKSAVTYELRKINSVSISQKEIEFLQTIDIQKDRKLLFSALVLGKALKRLGIKKKDKRKNNPSKSIYIRYSSFRDIARLVKMDSIGDYALGDIFHKYIQEGYITSYSPEKELIKLNYADENPEKLIEIKDLDDITKFYTETFSSHSLCSICKKPFVKKSNRQRVCLECKPILNRKRVSNHRANKKNEKCNV